MPKLVLEIGRESIGFVVDVPAWPGTPSVGRGRTMEQALGQWLRNNQHKVGIELTVSEAAQPAEERRRKRELRRR